ncbi:MAG: sugar phosphate isomerase/epimerase [Oscillospiraceae bacterium]|nr:sugar phosphate isomerase/epimerase [Oscillospiraceae bacterium]
MKLATTTGGYGDYTDSQAVALEHIRKVGFSCADYSFGPDFRRRDGVYSENYESYFEEITKACERIGIKLVQSHAPMGKPLEDPDGSLLRDTLRCIDACGAWGIPNIVVHSGYACGLTREETLEKNKEFFLPLIARAEKYGVNVLVENFNKMHDDKNPYWFDNVYDLLEMVERVNHPLFHAIWDVGHANMQEMPQDEALRILGSHVRAVHIQDNMGDDDTHISPFFGTLNLDSVMNGLLDIGYTGYFTFEVGNPFTSAEKRNKFERDTRLAAPPIELRDAFEQYLYDLGKCVLEAYNCFEE